MYRHLFSNRNFVALWVGQMLSFLGEYFNMLAIPILINRLTGSAMMVGFSMIANAIPSLLLGPLAGVFVDRWDRRKVMIISNLLRAALVLCLLTIHSVEQVWVFYVIGFLNACISQFFLPARGATLPLIITDKSDLLAANGLMQIIQMVGLLAGPGLAGFAIGLWGEKVAFIANSLGYLCSAAAVMTMRVPHTTPGISNGYSVRAVLADLREGLTFLFTSRVMMGVMICLSVAMLGIGGINVVWVPYLQRTFGIGAVGLGIVDSAQGAGMLVSGLALGFLAGRLRKSLMGSVGLMVIGVFFGLMGYSPLFPMIVVESFFAGLFLVPVQSALSTIQQLAVPDLKRGRVGSSMNAVTTVATLLSMAFASFFGEKIGLRNVYLVIGVFIVLSGILGFSLLQDPKEPVSQALPTSTDPGVD
jgi:MFS transporter, DHA3 family, macrolide efflux protein